MEAQMKKNVNKNQAGFTFVEIIVVLVILGIIAAIAVPKFISVTSDANKVAAEGSYAAIEIRLQHGLRKAQSGGIGSIKYGRFPIYYKRRVVGELPRRRLSQRREVR